jgi:hypothetical protein
VSLYVLAALLVTIVSVAAAPETSRLGLRADAPAERVAAH